MGLKDSENRRHTCRSIENINKEDKLRIFWSSDLIGDYSDHKVAKILC